MQVGSRDSEAQCLSGKDLSSYDYVSISSEGFVPVNVKPASISRLEGLTV